MNRYESYKDSGIPWLGEVPEHWEIIKNKFILKFSKGLTITKENLLDEGVPCVNYGEIHSKYGFEVNPKKHILKCVSEEYLKNAQNALLENGDFVFADTSEDIKGSGNFTYLSDDTPIFAGYHTIIAKPNRNKIFPRFLAYVFESGGHRNQIREIVKGVKVFSITQAFLKNTFVWLPPLLEQTAIADYLDNKLGEIDALISKQETLLEKLAEQRTAIITHAVTKGLNAHAPMKNSGVAWLGDVPEHWEIKKLKYLCKIVTGYTPSKNNDENYDENGFLWVKPDNLNDFSEIYETKEKISTLGLREGSLIPRGSILVCSIGTIGKMGIAGKDLLTNQQINSFIFNEKVNELFRKYLVYSAKGIFEYMANDNVVRILNSNTQKNIFFIVPPLSEQTAIANYLDEQTAKIDRLSDTVNQTIARLKEYRSALITQVVTGKIKVI